MRIIQKPLVQALLLSLTATSVMSCSQYNPDTDVKQAVNKAGEAKSLLDYENSGVTPADVVAKVADLRSEDQNRKLCEALLATHPYNVRLFEKEIKSKQYKSQFVTCKKELLKRIAQAYADEQKNLISIDQMKALGVKFNTKVRTKDMSKGWLVYSGDQGPNDVMLSFDDGPEPEHTPKVLEALAAAEVKATFFMISDHVQEHAEVAKRVAEEGHLVGSHTITHPFMGAVETCGKDSNPKRGTPEACPKNWVSDFREQTKEIAGGHEALFRTLGFVDPVFRFPFGANNPILRQFLFDHGVAAYFWNVDTNDWQLPTAQFDTEADPAKNKGVLFSGLQTKDLLQSVSEAMTKNKLAGKSSMMLMHDVHGRTAQMLPTLLYQLKVQGYDMVHVVPENREQVNSYNHFEGYENEPMTVLTTVKPLVPRPPYVAPAVAPKPTVGPSADQAKVSIKVEAQ